MRFTFLESLCDITHLKPLAQAAEAAGFTDVIVGFRDIYDPSTSSQAVPEKIANINAYAENIIHKSR